MGLSLSDVKLCLTVVAVLAACGSPQWARSVVSSPSPIVASSNDVILVSTSDPMPPEELAALPPADIRSVSAPAIREVSMAAFTAPVRAPAPVTVEPPPVTLLAPHRAAPGLAAIASVAELRTLVGRTVGPKDPRDPALLALAWARTLSGVAIDASSGSRLVAWAKKGQRLESPAADVAPGDLLVFSRVEGDYADLVAVVIDRDPRGVIEFAYLGGEIVRRGFVDPARPTLARDGLGGVVNTFLCHTRRLPPKGTRYLAGELLSHVVRLR